MTIATRAHGYRLRMPFSPVNAVSRTVGGLLASGTRALGSVRDATKPLHPDGELRVATVTRMGGPVPSGVPWLDEPGTDEALVRLSRAVGTPEALPDIHGLALRVDVHGSPADLLLASTGSGPLTRFVLLASRHATRLPLTSLLPYRSDRGPIVLAARADSERSFELAWARPLGSWVPFGRLELGAPVVAREPVSFDPVLHVLPGLGHYGWVRRLREPSYRTARTQSNRSTR